jgi:hypothetical protein
VENPLTENVETIRWSQTLRGLEPCVKLAGTFLCLGDVVTVLGKVPIWTISGERIVDGDPRYRLAPMEHGSGTPPERMRLYDLDILPLLHVPNRLLQQLVGVPSSLVDVIARGGNLGEDADWTLGDWFSSDELLLGDPPMPETELGGHRAGLLAKAIDRGVPYDVLKPMSNKQITGLLRMSKAGLDKGKQYLLEQIKKKGDECQRLLMVNIDLKAQASSGYRSMVELEGEVSRVRKTLLAAEGLLRIANNNVKVLDKELNEATTGEAYKLGKEALDRHREIESLENDELGARFQIQARRGE